jgi:hypothetical protein
MAEPATPSVYESVLLPLGENVSIRVITIRPSIDDGSDSISCDFHLLDLDTKLLHNSTASMGERGPIQYTALSYTWGEPPATETINLNGKPFPVRRNLWDFLCQARSDGLEEYLWIDALCIDQTADEERSHQVSIMGRIYSSASRVIVWLGVYSGLAAEGLLWITATYLADNLTLDTLPDYEKEVGELFKLPYWTRVWIVQEYVLAKSINIWLRYLKRDGEMFSWLFEQLRINSEAWRNSRGSFWLKHPELEPFYNVTHLPGMGIIIRRESEHKFSLSKDPVGNKSYGAQQFAIIVCELGPNMRCTDPRDRVYALLPLLSREASEELSITPDYSKTTEEVFVSIVVVLQRHKDETDRMLVQKAVGNLRQMLCQGEEESGVQAARE